jgi:outer membrane lipase/esterase
MKPKYNPDKGYRLAPKPLLVCAALMAFTQSPFAQQAPNPLGDFARENGGTDVQIAVADAVMNICPKLVGFFGGGQNVLDAPDSPNKDLTLRCGELIGTSVDFNDPAAEPSRSLGYTDPNSLLSALQEVNGEELNSQSTMTVRTSNSQAANIAGRMNAMRIGTLGAGSSGVASAFNLDINGVPMVAGEDIPPLGGAASADGDGSISPLGWFVNGSYNTGDSDDTDLQNGIDFDSYGITAGMDYRFNNNAVVGASIGYDDFDADFDSTAVVSGGDLSSDGFTGALFGLMEFGDFYVDGVAMYGQLDYEMDRILKYDSENTDPACQCPDQNRKIESDTEGDHYTVAINSGWVGYIDSWMLQPSLGLSYRNYEIDGYTEEDTLANGGMELRYDDQEVESLRSNLGLRVSRAFNQSYGVLMPTLSMDWYHEFEDDAEDIKTKYAQEDELARINTDPELEFSTSLSDCLSCFTIRGEDPDADYGVIGAGVSLVLPNQIQLLAHYEGLVGYDDLTSHAFTISIRGQF